jgi:uncharacterized membrane protein YphA (DoxX/SURF4 family)
MRPALYLYAAGSVAAGLLDLIWGDFEAAHQPIQALGDYIPGRAVLAVIAAIWLIAGGAAILSRRLARAGALALAAIYLIFAIFWLPRFHTATHLMGYTPSLLAGLSAGVGQQLILVAAAILVYASLNENDLAFLWRATLVARWSFGLSTIAFGLAHLTGVAQVSAMVPKWMPLGGKVWAILTGIAFVAAGIAMLTRILDELAARLLALMLLIFSVLVLAPAPVARPHEHVAWGSNAYNLAATGAAAIFAESIAMRRRGYGKPFTVPHKTAF